MLLDINSMDTKPLWLDITHITSAILLLVAVVISASAILIPYILTRWSQGRVKLRDEPGSNAQTRKGILSSVLLSHVDSDLEEDGSAVDLAGFWKEIRLGRSSVALLTVVGLTLQVYIVVEGTEDGLLNKAWSTVRLVSETLTWFYLVALSGCYVSTKKVVRHKQLAYHICALSAVFFLHWYLATLGQYLALSYVSTPHWSEYAVFATDGALLVTGLCIPLGPRLYQDLSRMYSKAVTAKIEKEGQVPTPNTHNVNEEVSSSIFGQLAFSFVYPMILKTSSMDQVDMTDMPAPQAFFRTQNILHKCVQVNDQGGLRSAWGPTIALLWTVWAPQWRSVLKGFGYMLALCPLWYLPHICLQQILYVLDNGVEHRAAVAFAVLLVLARVGILVILLQQLNVSSTRVQPQITTHTSYLLYQKLLTRNIYATPEAAEKGKEKTVTSKADILNLISSDTTALARIGWTGIKLIRALVELCLGCSYVWILLGPSGFWGLATLILTFPPAYFITKLEYKIFEKRLAVKDEKISMMQEAIQAISMIKMMAAEKFWFGRINEVRNREFKRLTQARLLGFVSGFLYAAAPTLVVVVAFAHYTLVAKQQLTATIAFTSIAVFDELRPTLMELPTSLAQLLQEVLSAKRIGVFLRSRDVDYLLEPPLDNKALPEADSLYVRGTVTWDIPPAEPHLDSAAGNNPIFQLRDLQLDFPRGKITLIAGKFGSGKTLLLLALLGEARLLDGKISYLVSPILHPKQMTNSDWSPSEGGVAYVPQTPWLQSQSIRDNVLFGLPMDIDRYKAVLFAVGLMPDLELLDDADLTEIGERGKILSGGQKARVSLARAVYSRASVLLLDDVISAVDAQTSKHIVENCFRSPLMAERTIIIASHAVEALAPLASHSIFLDDGRAVWTGTGPELLESKHMSHLKTEPVESAESELEVTKEWSDSLKAVKPSYLEIKEAVPKTPKQLLIEEQRAKGAVSLTHWRDLKTFNGNNIFWAGLLTVLILTTIAPVAERFVLESWTHRANTVLATNDVVFWVGLYTGLAVGYVLLDTLFGMFRFWGGLHATKRIHSEMLESILRSKMAFFSKTRAGSIVQRFGEDLNDVLECSELFGGLGEVIVQTIVNILTVTISGGWIFGVVSVVLIVSVWRPGRWYRSSSRQIRRLQSIIPGPINALYGETVAGTAVIRAFGVQSIFIDDIMRNLNMKINVMAWTIYIARWLFINLRVMDVFIVSTALALILTKSGMTGAAAGFIMVFASNITWNVNWMLINLRQFELKGVSLERTTEYRLLPREGGETLNQLDKNYGTDACEELNNWPLHGELKVHELRVRYGPDLPDILHDVSFGVQGGQRVGIVGATGGGKSTLAKAFFSFVDITHGKIEIDGKDISTIPLGQVRSRLGIIAQDPILLSGSLRLNLDIEGKYSDDELYDTLHQVQLLKRSQSCLSEISSSSSSSVTAVDEEADQQNIFNSLDSDIKSGGENVSAGQKQLIALARALLKRHKVLILDEATASIDSATDAEISRLVHEEFKGVTVLIIAHRLRTIMPCSKILVMDKGQLVQQGSPLDLIKQDGGKFQTLCMAAGKEEYRHLLSLAEMSETKRELP